MTQPVYAKSYTHRELFATNINTMIQSNPSAMACGVQKEMKFVFHAISKRIKGQHCPTQECAAIPSPIKTIRVLS